MCGGKVGIECCCCCSRSSCDTSFPFSETDCNRIASADDAVAGDDTNGLSSLPSGVVDSELVNEGVRCTRT